MDHSSRKLSDEAACALVTAVVGDGVGGHPRVDVAATGFRAPPAKSAAGKALGAAGRILRVSVAGWGPAFEARSIVAHLALDLTAPRDEIVASILRGASALISQQSSRRVRARAAGIRAPLQKEEFANPSRLAIDVAAARTLHDLFGSDRAVEEWMRLELARIADHSLSRTAMPASRVLGLTFVTAFGLGPIELLRERQRTGLRSQWIENQIVLPESAATTVAEAEAVALRLIRGSHLAARPVLETVEWPPRGLMRSVEDRRWPAHPDGRGAIGGQGGFTREWRITFKRQDVSVREAFD